VTGGGVAPVTVYGTDAVVVCPSRLVAVTVKVRDPAVAVSIVAGLDAPPASTQDLIPGPPGPSAHTKLAVAGSPTAYV
jgi:hypothetical protein